MLNPLRNVRRLGGSFPLADRQEVMRTGCWKKFCEWKYLSLGYVILEGSIRLGKCFCWKNATKQSLVSDWLQSEIDKYSFFSSIYDNWVVFTLACSADRCLLSIMQTTCCRLAGGINSLFSQWNTKTLIQKYKPIQYRNTNIIMQTTRYCLSVGTIHFFQEWKYKYLNMINSQSLEDAHAG